MIFGTVLGIEVTTRVLIFAGILWIITIPLAIYKVMYPTAFQMRDQYWVRMLIPDIIVNAIVRLLGALFIVSYTLIVIAMLFDKFG